MYKKTNFDNGLRVAACPMPNRQSVALGIWIKVGSRYEGDQEKGISHFLEHLLFKGSKKYSCRKIKESIEGVGGSLNGFTSEELTCFLVKIPADYLRLALDILSDMVLESTLAKDDIEKEKAVILEELKMYKDQPQSYVHELLDELLWLDQPLGRPIIGTADSIQGMSQAALFRFKDRYYVPSNIVISTAGLLDYEDFISQTSKIFTPGKIQNGFEFLKVDEAQSKPQLNICLKDTEQTHMALGFRSLKRDHHLRYAQGLLHIILGANMSSRLFNELREKSGLAYEIGTHIKRFYDTGSFLVHAGIDNKKVAEALHLILSELKKIKKNLVSLDEFKRAKEFYLGQIKLALEDTLDHMLWIGESTAALNKTYSLSDIVKEINSVQREDILLVAKQIFKEQNLNLALIGPLQKSKRLIYDQLNL